MCPSISRHSFDLHSRVWHFTTLEGETYHHRYNLNLKFHHTNRCNWLIDLKLLLRKPLFLDTLLMCMWQRHKNHLPWHCLQFSSIALKKIQTAKLCCGIQCHSKLLQSSKKIPISANKSLTSIAPRVIKVFSIWRQKTIMSIPVRWNIWPTKWGKNQNV